MSKSIECNEWTRKNAQNVKRLALWTGIWLVTMAIAAFGPKFLWPGNEMISTIFIAINWLIGVGMIWANGQHLRGLDELQQKIQLEAMALSLGGGLICGLSYSLMDTTNVIQSDAEISYLVMLMSAIYMVGLLRGNRRYQ
ncbi:hypothetical protein [Pleionea sp. CnH1-48]|uniref:hypothetical protein n=1 Tax=Pleionea sp. CnH1-48 TaxID=2954494 RepID=UPI00209769C6|nr:hypothetical protein [Pleionea sp. CnH1-48]MCO7224887.1 hypothetical protein [Pleionea sp. CnH1-48]